MGSRGCKLRGKFGVTAGSIGMVLQFMNMSSIYWGKYRAEYELIILVESFGPGNLHSSKENLLLLNKLIILLNDCLL